MDSKPLARVGAAVFVGLAVAMTLMQLGEEPAADPEAASGTRLPDGDPLTEQLRDCADMGERALSAPECRAAWAEKRRRFLGGEQPDTFSGLNDPVQPPAVELLMPSVTGEQRRVD